MKPLESPTIKVIKDIIMWDKMMKPGPENFFELFKIIWSNQ